MKIKILFFTIVRTILYRIVILSAFFSITANIIAQDQKQKVTISGYQLTIKDAFEEVEKQTGMTIAYNESLINVKQTVSVNISNKSLSEALTEILKNTNTTFNIKNKQILIVKKVTQQSRKVTGTIVDDNIMNLLQGLVYQRKIPQMEQLATLTGSFLWMLLHLQYYHSLLSDLRHKRLK